MGNMTFKDAIDYLQPIADNAELTGYSEALGVAMDALWSVEQARKVEERARKIYGAAMDTFGEAKQTIKLSEEIGEFLAAFCQYFEGRDKLSHVAEEMADVHNMLDQWAVHLGCEDEVERQKRYKLKRLEQRVEKAKLESNLRVVESNLRVNEPLTLEEMQNMMGEPVWIVDRHGNGNWEIVSKGILSIYNGYTAYRSKPEVQNGRE